MKIMVGIVITWAASLVGYSLLAQDLITKQFEVPPSFFEAHPVADPFAPEPEESEPESVEMRPALEVLEEAGISFGKDSAAVYLHDEGKLLVRQTPQQMELIEVLIQSILEVHAVMIYTTFRDVIFEGDPFADVKKWGESGARLMEMKPVAPSEQAFDFPKWIKTLSQNLEETEPREVRLVGVLTDPQFQVLVRAMKESEQFELMDYPSAMSRPGEPTEVVTPDGKYAAVVTAQEEVVDIAVSLSVDDDRVEPISVVTFDGSIVVCLRRGDGEKARLIFTRVQLLDPAGQPIEP